MKEIWTDKKRGLFGLPLSFTRYTLTEDRLYIRTGVFTRVEDEIWLYRILDVTLRQTLWQRIDRVGSIHCCSSDASQKEFTLENVKNSKEVKELLSNMIETQRERKRVYFHETLASDPDDNDILGMNLHQ